MELVALCELELIVADLVIAGDGPSGMRVIAEVLSGDIKGERMSGKLKGPAADWLVVNGVVGTVDVRATLETDDGAIIYTHYCGRMDLSEGPGGKPFYVTPVFETGDERYQWLNVVQAVGKGTLTGNNLHYDWYELR